MIYVDRSDILLGMFVLFSVVFLIVVGLVYAAERYTKKALLSYAQFQNTKSKLENLEKDLDQEASKWPIYARPVLFKTIDKSTQCTFGTAHWALTEARRIANEFPSVPKSPSKALHILSPFQCARRILHCQAVIQQESELAERMGQLENDQKKLRHHGSEEKRTLQEVEQKLVKLKARLSAAEKKVAEKAHGESFNETIGWVINYAQIGMQASSEKLDSPREKGLLNYAIADTFISLTNYLLAHFDLSAMDVSYSAKFTLDRFESRLKDFENHLRKVIEAKARANDEQVRAKATSRATLAQTSISDTATRFTTQTALQIRRATYQQAANAIETWDDVTLLDSLLVVLSQKLERASSSFSFFQKTYTIYLDLTQKIASINIPHLQEESLKLETECERYWGKLAEIPFHWLEGLQGSAPPSVEFNSAKDLYLSQIARYFNPDSKIKQSELTGVISKMTYYLVVVENGRISYRKLSLHLQVHKDAEAKVAARLANNGSTGDLVKDMESRNKDYAETNRQECSRNRTEFDGFIGRAKKITGANFPAMLLELDTFERKCRSLMLRHSEQIKVLHQQCETNVQELNTRKKTILQFKIITPKIKYDFPSIETEIQSIVQKAYKNSGNVQWLEGYLKEVGRILGNADQALGQLNAEWEKFADAEQNTFALLTQYQASLARYQSDVSVSWMWVRKESATLLERARTKLEQLSAPLASNRDPQLKTSVSDAIRNCQRVNEELSKLNSTTLDRLDEIQQQQDEFGQFYEALMNIIDKPLAPIDFLFKTRPKVPVKIRELCFLATQVHERMQVRSLLSAADSYFQKQLTEEDAEKLIQEYHINYGTIIEQQNNHAGATVNNAGRDINSRGNQLGST